MIEMPYAAPIGVLSRHPRLCTIFLVLMGFELPAQHINHLLEAFRRVWGKYSIAGGL
jgi:hypothetical protein